MSGSGERAKVAFLPQLESLRGMAALTVAYSHCSVPELFTYGSSPGFVGFYYNFIDVPLSWVLSGAPAVMAFFVISGLVLSLSLDKVPALQSFRAFGTFVLRRVLRIFPAHLVALLLFVPFAYLTLFRLRVADPAALEATTQGMKWWLDGTVYGHLNRREWLHTAILYNNYYNPVTWSLRVEMLGSLCMPLFAALSCRGRWPVDLGILTLLFAAVACVDAAKAPDQVLLYLPAFYLGCMIRTHGRWLGKAVSSRARMRAAALLLSLVLLLIVPRATTIPGTQSFVSILGLSLGAFGVVTIVAWGGGKWIRAALMLPPARWLGRISYSFYLWHWLVLVAFTRLLFVLVRPEVLAPHFALVELGTVAVTIPVALGVAALSYAFVEKPFIAVGYRIVPSAISSRAKRPNGADLKQSNAAKGVNK